MGVAMLRPSRRSERAASLPALGCSQAAWLRFWRSGEEVPGGRGDVAAKSKLRVRGFAFRAGSRQGGAVSISALGYTRGKMRGGRGSDR